MDTERIVIKIGGNEVGTMKAFCPALLRLATMRGGDARRAAASSRSLCMAGAKKSLACRTHWALPLRSSKACGSPDRESLDIAERWSCLVWSTSASSPA